MRSRCFKTATYHIGIFERIHNLKQSINLIRIKSIFEENNKQQIIFGI